jgi:hypothetical protein
MNVNVTIRVQEQNGDNNRLRRAYVEHLVLGVPIAVYITDDRGRVMDKNGNHGIQNPTPNVDIRVLCQNSVVKVLNGAAALTPVWQDFAIQDGDTVLINTAAEQVEHYRILNRCLLAYDRVYRQFNPFRGSRFPDFPLSRQPELSDTKDQAKRIEVAFPDNFPLASASFTEPTSSSAGFPLVHLRQSVDATVIPHELSHALHFSLLTKTRRERIERDYLQWIATDAIIDRTECEVVDANGVTVTVPAGGRHWFTKRTTQMVAYIEAVSHFGARFETFLINRQQAGITNDPQILLQRRQDFLDAELDPTSYWGADLDLRQAGVRQPNGAITPITVADQCTGNQVAIQGPDMEGAVYGAIFLDFASRVGLRDTVRAYFLSGATDFGLYRRYVHDRLPQHAQAIDAAQQAWGL